MEEEDLVLCTVERISGTTIFVSMEGSDKEGTIVTSEIAPGRIRNLRDYVIPGKKIVCKVLSINKEGNIQLSLRRVTLKEKKEVLDKYEKEKTSLSILKSVLKDKTEEIAKEIKKKSYLHDFLSSCKENPKKLCEYVSEEDAKRICKILIDKKERQVEVKKTFFLSSSKSNGLEVLKKILMPYKSNIIFLAAGRYMLKIKGENYKQVNQEMDNTLKEIENNAEKENCEFKVKEK